MKTTNYSELRNNLKSYFDNVINNGETVVVNRSKGKAIVIISLEEYNSMKETEYIMSSKKMMEIIRQGDKEIQEGEGTPITTANIWI